jgi:hypothetical protein
VWQNLEIFFKDLTIELPHLKTQFPLEIILNKDILCVCYLWIKFGLVYWFEKKLLILSSKSIGECHKKL